MPPEPHGVVAKIDAALMKQILHVPKRQRKPDVQHHCQADDLGARLEVLERGTFGHDRTLAGPCPASNGVALTRPNVEHRR